MICVICTMGTDLKGFVWFVKFGQISFVQILQTFRPIHIVRSQCESYKLSEFMVEIVFLSNKLNRFEAILKYTFMDIKVAASILELLTNKERFCSFWFETCWSEIFFESGDIFLTNRTIFFSQNQKIFRIFAFQTWSVRSVSFSVLALSVLFITC